MRTFLFTLLSIAAAAQTAPAPKFDVASIKPAAPGGRGGMVRMLPGGRIHVANISVKDLIVMAYKIQPFQVSGAPSWTESERYDIEAKPDSPVKSTEWGVMMQGLLADRFGLVFHKETKESQIYALVLARKDGKLGANLTESKEGNCTQFDPSKPPPRPEPGMRGCGSLMMSPRQIMGYGIPIERLVPMLSRIVGREIVDQTGLTGNYDVKIDYTPDEAQMAMMAPPGAMPPQSGPGGDSTGPSIFTALQEQLGLKLESQKGPVDIYVIDKITKPSDN